MHPNPGGNAGAYSPGDCIVVAPSKINAKDVDSLLVKELNSLSIHDREQAMDEIHGVHGPTVQRLEDQHLETALQEMKRYLETTTLHKPSYDRAVQLNSRYIHSKTLRIKFLRTEHYDAKKAAIRMIKYFDQAYDLYGDVGLMRPVRLSDLGENAKAILKESCFTLLPGRDPSGRRMIASLADVGPTYPVCDRAQAAFYVWQCASDDETTQRLGSVHLVFFHKLTKDYSDDTEDKQGIKRMVQAVSLRISGIHMCLPDQPYYHAMRATYTLFVHPQVRTRTRIHIGSIQECCYSLKSFGIPVKYLPTGLNLSSKETIKQTRKWLDMRSALETKLEQRNGNNLIINSGGCDDDYDNSDAHFYLHDIIECPLREDVLFGKGMPTMRHAGNVAMRRLLEERWERYEAAEYSKKTDIAWEVVFEIQRGEGRFLKEDNLHHWYVQVDNEVARQKVSIALRDLVKRRRKQQTGSNEEVAPSAGGGGGTASNGGDGEESGLQTGSSGSLIYKRTTVHQKYSSTASSSSSNLLQANEGGSDDDFGILDLSYEAAPKRRKFSRSEGQSCFGNFFGARDFS